jgi:hypothetical protein
MSLGLILAVLLKVIYLFDPKMMAVKKAIVEDKGVLASLGKVEEGHINVYDILETGDSSRLLTRIEYTASVTGSQRGGRVKVLLKKSNTDGSILGLPRVVELRAHK